VLTLYHSPLSRSVRIVWLLEELGLPYEVKRIELASPAPRPFVQKTPSGKVPTLVDGDVTLFESGAIVEYLLEKHGRGRLAPPVGSPLRGPFLQWIHFAESTAFGGLANIAWHLRFKQDAAAVQSALADYRTWVETALDALEKALAGKEFVLGSEFSGADIMLGYTLLVARFLKVLDGRHPACEGYLDRLMQRPAFQKALQA
jgi:glutathione S-transferase